jgi:carbonic anhydrase/acetyltransferase-like protein (isoleucine patch superfamily)
MPLYELDGVRPVLPVEGHYWIAPDAQVIGKVRLEEDASIWFGCVLRGDNEEILIGRGANIQDGSVLHTDMGFPLQIGAGCTIGHKVILHGCRIGDNSLIGMGSTILDGAVIGKQCLVGANSLVTQKKSFPDNSLIIGSPAKAVRTLDGNEIAALHASGAGYVKNALRFSLALKVQ